MLLRDIIEKEGLTNKELLIEYRATSPEGIDCFTGSADYSSIYFYVYAQRILGAARTSAYYAIAPFIGVFLSLLIFREIPGILFIAAVLLMIIGAWLSSQDKPLKETIFIIPSKLGKR